MASIDPEIVRHALKTARDHGYAEVEIGVADASFRARLEPGSKKKSKAAETQEDGGPISLEPAIGLIKAPIVGFYRQGPTPLEKGKNLKKGDIVAVINALGIANDVESQIAGEISEVLVEDGQSVEFGQVLAKVKA
jgi:acetyl-CoA carboxylase biotin carboxyl carrier protein